MTSVKIIETLQALLSANSDPRDTRYGVLSDEEYYALVSLVSFADLKCTDHNDKISTAIGISATPNRVDAAPRTKIYTCVCCKKEVIGGGVFSDEWVHGLGWIERNNTWFCSQVCEAAKASMRDATRKIQVHFGSGSEHVSQRAAGCSRDVSLSVIGDSPDPLSFSEIREEDE